MLFLMVNDTQDKIKRDKRYKKIYTKYTVKTEGLKDKPNKGKGTRIPMYRCKIDKKEFKTEAELIKHLMEEHVSKEEKDKEQVYSYSKDVVESELQSLIKDELVGYEVRYEISENKNLKVNYEYRIKIGIKIEGEGVRIGEVNLRMDIDSRVREDDLIRGKLVYRDMSSCIKDRLKNIQDMLTTIEMIKRIDGVQDINVREDMNAILYQIDVGIKGYYDKLNYIVGMSNKYFGGYKLYTKEEIEEDINKKVKDKLEGEIDYSYGYNDCDEDVTVLVDGININEYLNNKRATKVRVEILEVESDDVN